MSDRSRKKERQRLKREQKRQSLRKQRSAGVIQRLGNSDGVFDCYITAGWEQMPQAGIFVLREIPGSGGRYALASFLIDFGVLGLKDAWGRLSITKLEFREEALAPAEKEVPMQRADIESIRKLVAGAIRFRHDYGFKQVERLDRWLAVIGGVGDWKNADVSEFAPEYAETIEYLKRHLVACTPEEFLGRNDIAFAFREIFDPSAAEHDEEDASEQDFAEMLDVMVQSAAGAIRKWCDETGQTPHPKLEDAVRMFLEASSEGLGRDTDLESDDDPTEREAQASLRSLGHELALKDEAEAAGVKDAISQVFTFSESFPSRDQFIKAMTAGIDDEA